MTDKPSTPLPPPHHGRRLTEQRNPASREIDRVSAEQAVAIMQAEDRRCIEAAAACRPQIAAAAQAAADAFRAGGRLFYIGAGTSGRLGVLDASEQPPTFGVSPDLVQGIIAGGRDALVRSIEGAEDSAEQGATAIAERAITGRDVVFGITTGGRAAYVLGALAEARRRSARTVLMTCTPPLPGEEQLADIQIHALVGPEVVTGSTRLKAGTVTKIILNQVTTVAMIQHGKVYENLMVDLKPVNAKLVDRAARILHEVAGLEHDPAVALLERAGRELKVAIVMAVAGIDAQPARDLLAANHGHVADAIRGLRPPG